ncbi:EH_Signature domain [Hoeflea sp. IMCC20628]|uniref:EH signature domain-containing protein n=1 Tax=Hoeflea sp. IMCC20628 TaxID=1620421 RepID=UPI00063A8726|nr:EH signature domain-containing protein [Hoeflea sp. IMCC20628]AKI01765.1 EH_Signature domain [Hoeflea sp. IMCC20628]
MTGALREACEGWSSSVAGTRSTVVLPAESFTTKAAARIGAAEMNIIARTDTKSMNEISMDLLKLLHSGGSLSSKQLRDAIWCLWGTTPALADYPEVFSGIMKMVEASPKRKPFRNLATVYLVQFSPKRQSFIEASSALQRLAIQWGKPWADHQQLHSLYDCVAGPRMIAKSALQQNQSATQALQAMGLGALNAQSGFAEAITRELLVNLANGAESDHETRLARVQAYAMDSVGVPLFNTLDLELAEALMKPFEARAPEKRIKDIFLNFILSIFGDPRIHPGRWERFPHIKTMVIAWLTEQSLRQFLDIVSRSMNSESDERMWKYRRAFWEAAHQKGLIRGAWVVFAEEGAALARRSFGKNVAFARFSSRGGKQVHRTHAVLLLEVGNGIVADWSHSGKVNIWSNAQDRSAPQMYNHSYSSDDVQIRSRGGDMENNEYLVKSHVSPSTYSWQRAVAQRLYLLTKTKLQQSDYQA